MHNARLRAVDAAEVVKLDYSVVHRVCSLVTHSCTKSDVGKAALAVALRKQCSRAGSVQCVAYLLLQFNLCIKTCVEHFPVRDTYPARHRTGC